MAWAGLVSMAILWYSGTMKRLHNVDPLLRFWQKVNRTHQCWIWTATQANGYGQFNVGRGEGKRHVYAHRWIYEQLVGPVVSHQVDHLCGNRLCVRPTHLQAVSQSLNIRRGVEQRMADNGRKQHCPQGHEYTPGNILWKRTCRTCTNTYYRRKRASSRPWGKYRDAE